MLNFKVQTERKKKLGETSFNKDQAADRSYAVATNPKAISRLISAAVVDKSFCKLLLSNPAAAMERGYRGETFDLTISDRALVLTIQAKSINDFAAQLIRLQENNCNGEWVVESRMSPAKELYPIPVKPQESWQLAQIQTI